MAYRLIADLETKTSLATQGADNDNTFLNMDPLSKTKTMRLKVSPASASKPRLSYSWQNPPKSLSLRENDESGLEMGRVILRSWAVA